MDLKWTKRVPGIITRAMNRRKEAKAKQEAEEAQAEVRELASRILATGDTINTPIMMMTDSHVTDAAMMTPRLQNLKTQLQNPPGPGKGSCCFCGADVYYKAIQAANCPRCHRLVCGSHVAPSLSQFSAMKRICPDCLVLEIKVILMNGSVEITGEEMVQARSYTLTRQMLNKTGRQANVTS